VKLNLFHHTTNEDMHMKLKHARNRNKKLGVSPPLQQMTDQKRDRTLSKKLNEVTKTNSQPGKFEWKRASTVPQEELDQIKLDGEEHRKRLLEAVAKNYKVAKSLIECGDKSLFRLIAA